MPRAVAPIETASFSEEERRGKDTVESGKQLQKNLRKFPKVYCLLLINVNLYLCIQIPIL